MAAGGGMSRVSFRDRSQQGKFANGGRWSPRRGPILALAFCGAILISAIAVATAVAVYASRDRAISASKRELENNARLLSRHFENMLGDFAAVVKSVAEEIQLDRVSSPATFERMASTAAVHRMLASKVTGARELVGVNLWSAEGRLLNASQRWPVADRSVSQRRYFNTLKSDTTGESMVIELVSSQFVDGRALVFAQKITSPQGQFLGLITRSLSPKSVEKFFASVALHEASAIALVHADGTLIARYPQADHLVGTNVAAASQDQRARDSAAQAALTSGPLAGAARFAAPAQIGAFPLTVVVSATVDAALKEWREQTRLLVIVASLSALVISITLFLIIRQLRRQYEASRRRLMVEKQRLDTAVNNISHGLLLFDSDQRLVLCNERYVEMFGASRDVIRPGCTLRELIQHRKDTGSFLGDVDAQCAAFLENVRQHEAGRMTIGASGGRIIQLVYHAVPDGGWVTTLEDVTEQRRTEERIARLAHYDALTELPNRLLFHERLSQALQQGDRNLQVAVLYIDIDGFKAVNDSLGHSVGDELLKGIAGRLRDCLNTAGLVARLGGDEFAIIQTNVKGQREVTDLVDRIYAAVRAPFHCMGHQLMTDASIGIALAVPGDNDLEQLVKNADLAMYDAKASGRRNYRFFDPSLEARAKARHLLELDLRQAAADRGFEIHYQPVVDLRTDRIAGCEALLRWYHPERGFVSPGEFIPVAEDIGLIDEIGEWVLNTACAEAASWPAQIRIAVNVSPTQFRSRTLALKVAAALARSGLSAERLELEITEAVLIQDHDIAIEALDQLRALGVGIALDDFGTGYSSLSYLHRFRFDKIKIDRSFISNLSEDKSLPILQAALGIAKSQKMITTAEGVETEAQRCLLRDLGCTQMQGYLFSPARPAGQVRQILRGEKRAVAIA
jgi:diguanylate cyclase (GGDEF)-like protein